MKKLISVLILITSILIVQIHCQEYKAVMYFGYNLPETALYHLNDRAFKVQEDGDTWMMNVIDKEFNIVATIYFELINNAYVEQVDLQISDMLINTQELAKIVYLFVNFNYHPIVGTMKLPSWGLQK